MIHELRESSVQVRNQFPPRGGRIYREEVGRNLSHALGEAATSPDPKWLNEYSLSQAHELLLNALPHLYDFFDTLHTLRTSSDETISDTFSRVKESIEGTKKSLLDNEQKPKVFKDLADRAHEAALLIGLTGTNSMRGSYLQLLLHKKEIEEHAPKISKRVITSTNEYFTWEAFAPYSSDYKKFPKNPFFAPYQFYRMGFYDQGFETDEEGNEYYTLHVKSPDTENGLITFKTLIPQHRDILLSMDDSQETREGAITSQDDSPEEIDDIATRIARSYHINRNRRIEEDNELLGKLKDARDQGEIAVLTKSLTDPEGLMHLAESLDPQDSQSEKLRSNLITGAATTLTDCVLGYPEMIETDHEGNELWEDHFHNTAQYLSNLYSLRSQVPEKKEITGNPEVAAVIQIIEKALTVKNDNSALEALMEEFATKRAQEHSGISTQEPQLDNLKENELDYLHRCLEAKEATIEKEKRSNLTIQQPITQEKTSKAS